MIRESEKQYRRTAIYIAPSAYGLPVDLEEALEKCKSFIEEHKELRLMRIYRDEQVKIIRTSDEDKKKGKRKPLCAEGNDAWKKLLADTETSAVEVVIIYAARTVAPSFAGLAYLVREYFVPCGIRFIDVEARFDTIDGDLESYLKKKNSDFRYTVKHKPHKKYRDRRRVYCTWEDETE